MLILTLFLTFVLDDVNDITAEFMSMFKLILEFCIPHYTTTVRPRDKPYMTSELRCLMRKRDRFHQLFKREPKIAENRSKYVDMRNKVVACLRHNKVQYEQTLLDALQNDKIIECPKNIGTPYDHSTGKIILHSISHYESMVTLFPIQYKKLKYSTIILLNRHIWMNHQRPYRLLRLIHRHCVISI